jgi:hypothetical protein
MLTQIHNATGTASKSAMVPLRRPVIVPKPTTPSRKN